MDSRPIIIKKYGNRRLYDLSNSRYVNLEEVAQMVREGRDVQVLDATTNEDLTRTVLTQIIVDQAKADDSVFPLDVLRQMVAGSGKATSEAAMSYMKNVFDVYQNAYRAVTHPAAPDPDPPKTEATSAPPRDEGPDVEALKRRVEELEASVRDLKRPVARRPKSGSRRRR